MTGTSHQPMPVPGILRTARLVAWHQAPLRSTARGLLPIFFLVTVPLALAVILAMHVRSESGDTLFFGMVQGYFIQFATGVLMLGIGLAGFPSDESNGVLAYLLTKPVPRSGILLGRLVSACAVGSALVLLSASACGLILGSRFTAIVGAMPALLAACIHYGVVFTVLPLFTSRAMAVGLIYVLVWESVLVLIPGAIHTLTSTFYVRALLPAAATPPLPDLPFFSFLLTRPSFAEAAARLALTWIAVAGAGYVAVRRRDYSASREADEGA